MYDLEGIRRAEEAEHCRAVERANERKERKQRPVNFEVFPLSDLAKMLLTGPPSLSHLTDLLENANVIAEFHDLLAKFLPEHAELIMSQDNEGRVRQFVRIFEKKYFPLSDNVIWDEFSIGGILNRIPVDYMGFSREDFHNFANFRNGYTLMLAVCSSMWDEDEDEDRHGGRVAILDRAMDLVDDGLIKMIPAKGWSREDIHRLLADPQWEGIVAFSDWVNASTNTLLLDTPYDGFEDFYGEEADFLNWSVDTVDNLTVEWPQVEIIQEKILKASEWLENDTNYRFRLLMSVLTENKELVIPKEQLSLPI